MAVQGLICQGCGVEAPAKYVEFYQNIGFILARQHSSIKGNLCKNCVHAQFWKRTMITLGVGWLGTISIVIAPIFILMNVVRYLGALGMPPVPAGATPPMLTDQTVQRLNPHAGQIIDRLNCNEPLNHVAVDIAARAGVTPGQLILYVQALAEASRQQQVASAAGENIRVSGAAGVGKSRKAAAASIVRSKQARERPFTD